MKQIKYIFIDSLNENVSEITLDDGLQPMYDTLKCDMVEHYRIDDVNGIYMDEEGLFNITSDTKLFFYDNQGPFIGSGLVCGTDDEGITIDPTLSVDDIKSKVRFIHIDDIK